MRAGRHGGALWPPSPWGRRAVVSAVVFVVALGFMMIAAALGQRGGDAIWDNWWLGAPGLVAGAGALSALVTGIVAMGREHDRSVSVILATAIGVFVAIFLLGEILVPH
jgi:hypothetical protein